VARFHLHDGAVARARPPEAGAGPPRPTHVFNAGSSTELGRVRVFAHNGVGHLLGQPLWLDVPAPWADAYQAFAEAEDEALSAGDDSASEAGLAEAGGRLLLHAGP
jgi:hypothetical protein